MHWDIGTPLPQTWDLGTYSPPLLTPGDHHWKHGAYPHPMTTSGGHRNMYDWQAGGTHLRECFLVTSNSRQDAH